MSYFPQEQLQFKQIHSEHFFRQKPPQNDLNKMTLWSYELQDKIKKPRIWSVISSCQIIPSPGLFLYTYWFNLFISKQVLLLANKSLYRLLNTYFRTSIDKKNKLYDPFLWMGFICLKARATSRRQFTFYH